MCLNYTCIIFIFSIGACTCSSCSFVVFASAAVAHGIIVILIKIDIVFYLRSPYLIIISAICHCHSFKNELVLVLNTAWRKQPIADYVSNHNRTCGESVSENSE